MMFCFPYRNHFIMYIYICKHIRDVQPAYEGYKSWVCGGALSLALCSTGSGGVSWEAPLAGCRLRV